MPWKNKEAEKAYKAQYYQNNKESCSKRNRKSYLKYKKTEKGKLASKKYRTKYAKQISEYKKSNKDRNNELERISCKNLSTAYLKTRLKKLGYSKQTIIEIPEILKTYKIILKTKRLCEKSKTLQN